MSDQLLQALADAADIEARYWNIQGELKERSPETARMILQALGLAAQSQSQVRESLALLSASRSGEVLPPAICAESGSAIEIAVNLGAGFTGAWIAWLVKQEDGSQIAGQAKLSELKVEQTKNIDGSAIYPVRLVLPPQPPGYHELQVSTDGPARSKLIIGPKSCYLPEDASSRRYWGITAQLYAIRSAHNWGLGDFGDLRRLMRWADFRKADLIGLNPLHALFLDAPQDVSPYCPASRQFIHPLYLDVTAVADFQESHSIRLRANAQFCGLDGYRRSNLIDYPAVTHAKMALLAQLFEHFYSNHFQCLDARGRELQSYIEAKGKDLKYFAAYQYLSAKLGTHCWQRWPVSYQNSSSEFVARLFDEHAREILFYQYLQWQCDLQLANLAASHQVGLYKDLAIGVAVASADHWGKRDNYSPGLSIGAPPDPFNENGQDWGLIPENPRQLRASGYAHFIAVLRANMSSAKALRIDHIMGWQRLFVIPNGAGAGAGAYLRFPLDDLLVIAALESSRHKCLLIGEDLGTVPQGFREKMASRNVLSTRVLYFERDDGVFRRPEQYPRLAMASVSTHDLATIRGYWMGEDISVKSRLGLYSSREDEEHARFQREQDKTRLLQALKEQNLLPQQANAENPLDLAWSNQIASAIHSYLAMSPCLLFAMQLDDLADELQQINLPGTTTQYPNWRRRLTKSLEEVVSDQGLKEALAHIARLRNA